MPNLGPIQSSLWQVTSQVGLPCPDSDEVSWGSVLGAPVPPLPPDENKAPSQAVRFLRQVVPGDTKELMRKILDGPDTPKSHMAQAVALGVFGGFVPVPFMNFPAAAFLASKCKRSVPIAMFATLYNNLLTVGPLVYLEVQIGKNFFPDDAKAAFLAGTAILSVPTPILAYLLTLALHGVVKEPVIKLMEAISADLTPTPMDRFVAKVSSPFKKALAWGKSRYQNLISRPSVLSWLRAAAWWSV